jgi:hypothetical protein
MGTEVIVTTAPAKRRRMTREQATDCVKQINQNVANTRVLLWDLFSRRGWKALGYSSWRECVNAEFDQSQSYLYRTLTAAKIEREISPRGEIGVIPEKHLRPLSALNSGLWKPAWDLAHENAVDGRVTTGAIEAAVQRIMDTINAAKTDAAQQVAEQAAPSQPTGQDVPAFIDHIDPVSFEVTRVSVDVNLKAPESQIIQTTAPAAAEPATAPTASAETAIVENSPASAPDWKAIIDTNKFYGIDMHEHKVFTRGYAQQFQANMAYPHAPGQTNLRILLGSKLLALLMPGQLYDDYVPYPPATTPAPAPAIPFAFEPLGVYLYNPLDEQLYTDCFPNEATARADERTDARWYPETGAMIVRNWQRRFAAYSLMTLAERTAQAAPLTSIQAALKQPYTDTPLSAWEAGRAAAVNPNLLPSIQIELKDSAGFHFAGYTIAGTVAPERALKDMTDQEWARLCMAQDAFNYMMKAESFRRLQAAATQPAGQPV